MLKISSVSTAFRQFIPSNSSDSYTRNLLARPAPAFWEGALICRIPGMPRSAVLLAMGVVFLTATLSAQSNPPPAAMSRSAGTPSAACLATTTLDELVKAIDNAVSGPANQDRTCFRALFTQDARLIPIRIAADGTATPRILTVQDWIDAVAKRGSAALSEHQIKVRTESWAQLAHLWSTYTTTDTPTGKQLDRGINSIQAVYDGKQWRVIEIVWQAETPAEPVPEKYLP
jgi:hypothetical protein